MSENCSRCYVVQQSDSMEAYEKMTLILTWLITPVNSLLISGLDSLVSRLLQHSVMFVLQITVRFREHFWVICRFAIIVCSIICQKSIQMLSDACFKSSSSYLDDKAACAVGAQPAWINKSISWILRANLWNQDWNVILFHFSSDLQMIKW